MRDAILLAGGLGTRLAKVSGGRPKPLLEIAGRPFVEYVLDLIAEAGCARVVMAVAYRWEMLRDRLGDTYRGLRLTWSVEDEPLGTGGAVRLGFETLGLERAVVLNADTLFCIDLGELVRRHVAAHTQATLALRAVEDVSRFGAVELDDDQRIVAFHEKGKQGPGLINGGIYVLERSIFNLCSLPPVFSLERDLFQAELARLRPLGVPSKGYFIDIGTPDDLSRARSELNPC
jgi:D-glycero-alpha-D-manno-heptose 1-phosphate guanylyltransferase